MQTLSVEEVKDFHTANLRRENAPAGFDARKATTVMVKEALQLKNPVPYGEECLTPEMKAQRVRHAQGRGPVLSRKEHAEHVAHMRAQVTEEDHAAYAKAKATAHKDAVGVADAHHFAQKRHQMGLWAEAARLVTEAVGQ